MYQQLDALYELFISVKLNHVDGGTK